MTGNFHNDKAEKKETQKADDSNFFKLIYPA